MIYFSIRFVYIKKFFIYISIFKHKYLIFEKKIKDYEKKYIRVYFRQFVSLTGAKFKYFEIFEKLVVF